MQLYKDKLVLYCDTNNDDGDDGAYLCMLELHQLSKNFSWIQIDHFTIYFRTYHLNKNLLIATVDSGPYKIFAFNFDDQLNIKYFKYFTSGSKYTTGGNVMIQDIDNNGFLIANIDGEKRLRMTFANEFCQNKWRTYITSECPAEQIIVSLAFENKTK